jgi:hypothetical protein
MHDLATHWIYNTPTDLSAQVTFRCESKNNETKLVNSEGLIPTIPSKCLVFRVNKSCNSEKDKYCFLANYFFFLGLRYAQFILDVSDLHIRYVSISNAYLH